MKLKGLDAAVVGGGIGGVAAALALARHGARVVLYEQAAELAEVGAGLQISVNGQRVLRALGAVSDVPSAAVVSTGTILQDGRHGRAVAKIPAPTAGPTWYFHRADLLALLVEAAQASDVDIRLGQSVAPGEVEASLIVAADGARSIWRDQVDGPCTPRFTRQVAWRALVPAGEAPAFEPNAQLFMAHRAHVVAYPLRGGDLINLVAVEERDDWQDEGWRQRGAPETFHARFGQFGGDAAALISAAAEVHLWALHSRPIAEHWQRDGVALLGDAAHPTLPFMAQGACLALEDSWVLAAALAASADVASGLRAYETARRERARRVVALAAGNAWRFHLGRPWSWGAQAALALGAPVMARRLEWVYSYDATTAFRAELTAD